MPSMHLLAGCVQPDWHLGGNEPLGHPGAGKTTDRKGRVLKNDLRRQYCEHAMIHGAALQCSRHFERGYAGGSHAIGEITLGVCSGLPNGPGEEVIACAVARGNGQRISMNVIE